MERSVDWRKPDRGARRPTTLLAALVVMSLSSGCVTVPAALAPKAYEGPALPKEEVAVITTRFTETYHGTQWDFVRIAAVDGKGCFELFSPMGGRTPDCGSAAEVLPGRHDIDLERHTQGFVGSQVSTTRRLSFNAEAGRLYMAHTGKGSEQDWFWIEEQATGEVVAGSRPSAND